MEKKISSSRKRPKYPYAPADINFEEESVFFATISPEVATAWLELNTRNRPIRKEGSLASLVRDIINGAWHLNGSSIVFSNTGVLLDGQHRLLAAEISKCDITSVVVTGLTEKSQETMDSGSKRTFGDVLALRGVPNAKLTAAIVRLIWAWQKSATLTFHYEKPTNEELATVFESLSDLEIDVKRAGQVRVEVPCNPSILGFTSWLFRTLDEEDAAEDAEYFFERLRSGAELKEHEPILSLRNKLNQEAKERWTREQRDYVAWFIKAWNAYRDGLDLPLKKLQWQGGGKNPERFPKPH